MCLLFSYFASLAQLEEVEYYVTGELRAGVSEQ